MDKIVNTLWDNIGYIVLWGTIPVFTIVGKEWLWFALMLWMLASSMDILTWYLIALYKGTVSSNTFWKWIIKRAFILIIWGLMTIIFRHLSLQATYITDVTRLPIVIGAIPIGFFHMATLQELISIDEHAEQIFPEYKMFKVIGNISRWINKSLRGWIDRKTKKIADKVDDKLSPKEQ